MLLGGGTGGGDASPYLPDWRLDLWIYYSHPVTRGARGSLRRQLFLLVIGLCVMFALNSFGVKIMCILFVEMFAHLFFVSV